MRAAKRDRVGGGATNRRSGANRAPRAPLPAHPPVPAQPPSGAVAAAPIRARGAPGAGAGEQATQSGDDGWLANQVEDHSRHSQKPLPVAAVAAPKGAPDNADWKLEAIGPQEQQDGRRARGEELSSSDEDSTADAEAWL